MIEVIIRIELRGTPGGAIYDTLHTFMTTELKWLTTIRGDNGAIVALPHAMYSGTTSDIEDLSRGLKDHISTHIWTRCIVLVMNAPAWAYQSC